MTKPPANKYQIGLKSCLWTFFFCFIANKNLPKLKVKKMTGSKQYTFPQPSAWTYLHALRSRSDNCSQNPTMRLRKCMNQGSFLSQAPSLSGEYHEQGTSSDKVVSQSERRSPAIWPMTCGVLALGAVTRAFPAVCDKPLCFGRPVLMSVRASLCDYYYYFLNVSQYERAWIFF